MRTTIKISVFLCVFLFLCACIYTPDSVHVFDHDQARELIEESGFIPAGQQQVLLKLPPDSPVWKRINRPGTGVGYTISYAPKNSGTHWHEMIERKLIPYGMHAQTDSAMLVESEIQLMRKSCGEVQTKMLAATLHYQLYTLTCQSQNGKLFQIAKVFDGIDLIYMIRYTAYLDFVPSGEVHAYSEAIKEAMLIPTKKRV